jgi:ABC-type multidrug transport system ATPase subunit
MIQFSDVRYAYRPGELVLRDIHLRIPAGLTLLLGPNGCGKSTLLKLAAGVEGPDRGTVMVEGFDLWHHEVAARRNLCYVPEHPDLTPYATIKDVLRLVCRLRKVPFEQATQALQAAGMEAFSGRSIRELSMGQRRRAVLAAAWIGAPRVILLDEPLESMDRAIREQILEWITGLLDENACVVIATHEIEPFLSRAGRAVTLGDGICRTLEPLPADPSKRAELLEAISRGKNQAT